jgi:uncharacterized membrane protein
MTMSMLSRCALATLMVCVPVTGLAWTPTILPLPEGAIHGEGWAINEDGDVAGLIEMEGGDVLPVAWTGNRNKKLKVLRGRLVAPSGADLGEVVFGIAVAMSESGAIAGQAYTNEAGSYAATWDARAKIWRALPRPFPNTNASARGMNEDGDVVGSSGGRAIVWRGGQAVVLPPPNPQDYCGAYAINNAGDVAGWCYQANASHTVAVVWDDSGPRILWGNPGDDGTFARAINDAGEVVGTERGAALLWGLDDKKPLELAPVGVANGINNLGVSVGFVGVNGGTTRATVWNADGQAVDLGLLAGGSYSWLRAINDAGDATGMADDATGIVHPVVYRN